MDSLSFTSKEPGQVFQSFSSVSDSRSMHRLFLLVVSRESKILMSVDRDESFTYEFGFIASCSFFLTRERGMGREADP